MKIAILTPTYFSYSGIDQEVLQQAKEFIEAKQEVKIFTLAASIKENNIPTEIIGMPKKLFWQRVYRLFFFLDIKKIITTVRKLKNYEVIYSHLYPMNILARLAQKRYGKKYIYYNNGVPPSSIFPQFIEKIYITVFRFLNNFSAKKADKIISISHYLNEVFKKENNRSGDVMHCQINKQRFLNLDSEIIRKKYNINKDPLILYIGRISPHKGVHLLIKSFLLLLKDIPNAKLLIVGKHTFSKYSEQLKALSNSSIIFTGFVADKDLANYYAACDIYASASLWEGFNLPIIEAQYCHKPVVVFNIGPHPELVNKRGYLVPAGDTKQFAEALKKILRCK